MPQMMPLNWLFLSIFFIFMLIILFSWIYYLLLNLTIKFNNNHKIDFNKKWMWQW